MAFSLTFEARSNFERSEREGEKAKERRGNDIIALKGEDDEDEKEKKEDRGRHLRASGCCSSDGRRLRRRRANICAE